MATCYLKLRRFEEALNVFAFVLQRSPHNDKALYQHAFCQRALGMNRDAIAGLTSIIATANKQQLASTENNLNSTNPSVFSKMTIPLDRVYETRGALFHEMQSYKLALNDLGRAIALNPRTAENFYLRGTCQSKLGNYELAVRDFDACAELGMKDRCALCCARGMARRACGNSISARQDFEAALKFLHEQNGIDTAPLISAPLRQGEIATTATTSVIASKSLLDSGTARADAALLEIRLVSLRALCFLDEGMYNAGHNVLSNALVYMGQLESAMEQGFTLPEAVLNIELRVWKEEQAVLAEKQKAAEKLAAEQRAKEEMKTLAGRQRKGEQDSLHVCVCIPWNIILLISMNVIQRTRLYIHYVYQFHVFAQV